MASPHRTYQPRDAEHSVFHAVICGPWSPSSGNSRTAATDGLPRFVEQELREFLTCGVLSHGLPFSCKRRGFCPICWEGGRRMAERAASLVDEVLPRVPVRQWVLTPPLWFLSAIPRIMIYKGLTR